MTENPYQASVPPTLDPTGGYAANQAPGALKTICILCIVLGSLGFFGSLAGIGGLLFQEQLSAMQMNGPPSQQAMQAKMAEAQASFFIPNMLLVFGNLLISPMLLAGGIGVLTKKMWGPKLLSFALITAAVFVSIRTALTSFFQFQAFSVMKEAMTNQVPAGPGAGTTESIMMAAIYFGFALGAAIALALAAFYFWSWRYLKKDSCQQHLSTFAAS